jgi:hypothetical protein
MDFAAFHTAYETPERRDQPAAPDDFAGGHPAQNPGNFLGTVASVPRLMKGQGSIIATGTIRASPDEARHDHQHVRPPDIRARNRGCFFAT